MVKILARRTTVENRLAADDNYTLGVEAVGELVPELFGVAVGVLQYADLYEFAGVETVGKAFEHIFAYALLAHLTDGLKVCRD